MNLTGTSKYLSLILRHKPEAAGIVLDEHGWADVGELIEGIRLNKFLGVGLDVYEEETGNVYEDRSDDIMEHSVTARLLAFPNVMITSHQGFYTLEALAAIAETTLQNLMDAKEGKRTPNDVA